MPELPRGWVKASLDGLDLKIEAGLNVKCEERPPELHERGLVKISAVTWGRFDENASKTLSLDASVNERDRICTGDLLISRANTIELVGSVVLVDKIERRLYLSDKVLRLVVPTEFRRWAHYALKTPELRIAIAEASSGNQLSMRNIAQERIRALEISIAPLAEQQRIADKLDTVLARVDACRDRLARVAPLLKRFRQSVLSAATSGQLTNPQHAWRRARADEVCSKVQSGGTPKSGFSESGVPFLKVYNIVNQKVDFEYRPQFISEEIHRGEMRKSIARSGDVLMNIVGPPLGKVAVLDYKAAEWNINQAITLFRPSSVITTGWIHLLLCEGESVRAIMGRTKGSVGQINISLSQCRAFEFPVPPVEEQQEIVRRVETLFAFADRLEARLDKAQTAVDRLTPALLAKAFRGELVPQDPDDEPAAELLKRLAAERAASPATPRRRRARA
ncbi:MAG: restriction endonuclease subunit S [Pseudomonadota bacterium]|nr:restriction endonuclease subunit S [Pseudomonadota bacterium]